MTAPSPAFQSAAQRLIEDAANSDENEAALLRAAEQVFQRLHDHLGKFIGVVGFTTLLARALKLARGDAPALGALEVKLDGSLAGLSEAFVERSPTAALAAPVTLLAHLLGLLAAFLGEDLALHLVSDAMRRSWAHGKTDDREDQESARNPASEG